MLRRPATTLTLTPADIQAYESTRAHRLAALAADAKRKQKVRAREKARLETRGEAEETPSRAAGAGATAGTGTSTVGARPAAQNQGAVATGNAQGVRGARGAVGYAAARVSARGGGAAVGQRETQAQRIFGRGAVEEDVEEEEEDDEDDEEDEEDGGEQQILVDDEVDRRTGRRPFGS